MAAGRLAAVPQAAPLLAVRRRLLPADLAEAEQRAPPRWPAQVVAREPEWEVVGPRERLGPPARHRDDRARDPPGTLPGLAPAGSRLERANPEVRESREVPESLAQVGSPAGERQLADAPALGRLAAAREEPGSRRQESHPDGNLVPGNRPVDAVRAVVRVADPGLPGPGAEPPRSAQGDRSTAPRAQFSKRGYSQVTALSHEYRCEWRPRFLMNTAANGGRAFS